MEEREVTALAIGDVLYTMKLDAEVDVCDQDEETRWKGPVGRFPWSMTDVEVMQVDAVGEDSFRIVTCTDRTSWR